MEDDNALDVRVDKLYDMIGTSKYSVHDISRLRSRFNMPLELGIVLGAKVFGTGRHREKRALILDTSRYRYQRFCSDIAGQDIRAHGNTIKGIIHCVRSWLRASPDKRDANLPGADFIYRRFVRFSRQMPRLRRELNLDSGDLHFVDLQILIAGFLKTEFK